jgi:hypothetical protein
MTNDDTSDTSDSSATTSETGDETAGETAGDQEPPEIDDQPVAEPSVDTGPLERSQQAIDEGHDAAQEALSDNPPDEDDMNFSNMEQNTDPEAEDNAVPRPN